MPVCAHDDVVYLKWFVLPCRKFGLLLNLTVGWQINGSDAIRNGRPPWESGFAGTVISVCCRYCSAF